MKKLLEKIGDFFSNLFNGAKKTWKKLSPEVKDAMLKASKIVDIINTNVQQAPPFIIDLIKKQFPGLNVDQIKAIVLEISKDLKISENTNNDDLEVMLSNIQKLLENSKQQDGKVWAKISHTAYLAISVLLAPKGTKIAVLISLAEYVYHDLIKGGKKIA